jgi:hypothetical protein
LAARPIFNYVVPEPSAARILVRCPRHGAWLIYEVGPRFEELFAGRGPRDPAPPMGARDLSILAQVGLLLDPVSLRIKREESEKSVSAGHRDFRDKGYARIEKIVPAFYLGELRKITRRLIRKGALNHGDSQSTRRFCSHNEPMTKIFHWLLAETVGRIVGKEVMPSYTYLVSYEFGASLPRHFDRPQCEYTLALLVDYAPEPTGDSPWPLSIHGRDRTTDLFQGLGDGLLFRGRELEHGRRALTQGLCSTSLFLHYVDRDFSGSLD